MLRHRIRAAQALTAAVALGAIAAPGAGAHVTVQPAASRPADLQRYRLFVPNEREAGATTGVDLKLPPGVTFALVETAPGWRRSVVKRGSEFSELRWRRGSVAPGEYAELHFIVRNPVKVGPIAWKALQRYGDGTIVRWIGSPGSEQPAAVTKLSEDAVPVDVVSTHGEGTPAATAGAQPAATASGDGGSGSGSGRDGLTLAIAIAAALLGAAALGLQLLKRRP
ncbi:MAG: hypothetical protein QOK16_1655 [Solirubrobacteraceae bacterium]|jgi:uncharacterized protein YcnI|nr:hypothetical protein [Solirubrobacteraceae bacterium]MEA2186644.1 hypothetical protein [Solirubrobacteraceae bacterium]